MCYGIYRLLTRLTFSISFPIFLVYAILTGRHRTGLGQRLGFYTKDDLHRGDGPTIWLHGASVGEIKAAEPLLDRLAIAAPTAVMVVTTVTEQGLKLARQNLGDKTMCLIAPLDLPGAVQRAIQTIRPDIYICLETELWPNTLAGLYNHGVESFLLNARLSEKSFRRYRRLRGFTRKVLAGFSSISAISGTDAERFIGLGAAPAKVAVGGNVKYDLPPYSDPDKVRLEWQQVLGLSGPPPVLVAGSTHGGEDLQLLEAFRELKHRLPDLVMILAPRHLERIDAVCAELAEVGAEYDLLSRVKKSRRLTDIVVVDTMGELSTLYSVATYIFCGGSLVDRGGHNIMEAARWGCPVLYGPSMNDFTDAQELLETSGGGFQISNITALVEKITELSDNQALYRQAADAARFCASRQNGAVERQLKPVIAALQKLAGQKIHPGSQPV